MVDILHKVGIESSSVDTVYQALTTREGLESWWTNDVKGETKAGGVLKFRFGNGGFDVSILDLNPNKHVVWEVIRGPEEWLGTKVSFDLEQKEDWSIILFKHEGWKKPEEFMYHCSTKWAIFLLSLKSVLETGQGRPYPDVIPIDAYE